MLQSADQHTEPVDHPLSDDLSKLIRKLRWMGMDDEAERLQFLARTLPPSERGTIFAEAPETD
jgi:hypothetical protein